MSRRAFEVVKAGAQAGFLGEGRGPFIFASDSDLAYPILRHARFTASDDAFESDVGDILQAHGDFESCVVALKAAGFELKPVDYALAFEPASSVPVGGPSAVRSDDS